MKFSSASKSIRRSNIIEPITRVAIRSIHIVKIYIASSCPLCNLAETPFTSTENYAEESDFYYRIDDLKGLGGGDKPRLFATSVRDRFGRGHIPKMKYRSSLETQPVECIPRERSSSLSCFRAAISRDKRHFQAREREREREKEAKVIIRWPGRESGCSADNGPTQALSANRGGNLKGEKSKLITGRCDMGRAIGDESLPIGLQMYAGFTIRSLWTFD